MKAIPVCPVPGMRAANLLPAPHLAWQGGVGTEAWRAAWNTWHGHGRTSPYLCHLTLSSLPSLYGERGIPTNRWSCLPGRVTVRNKQNTAKESAWSAAAGTDAPKGWGAELRALTTVGLFHTVCRQCFTAPQSAAVFTFWHHTAEPLVHSFRPRTGLATAESKTAVRRGPTATPGPPQVVTQG